MNKIQKMLSILLSAIIVCSMFPSVVSGATVTMDNKTHDYSEINSLSNDYSYGTLIWTDKTKIITESGTTASYYAENVSNRWTCWGFRNKEVGKIRITNCAIDQDGDLCDAFITVNNVKQFPDPSLYNNLIEHFGGTPKLESDASKVIRMELQVGKYKNTNLICFWFNTRTASGNFSLQYLKAGTKTLANISKNLSIFGDIDASWNSTSNGVWNGSEGFEICNSKGAVYYEKNHWLIDTGKTYGPGVRTPKKRCETSTSFPNDNVGCAHIVKDNDFDLYNSAISIQQLENATYKLYYSGHACGMIYAFVSPYTFTLDSPIVSIDKDVVFEGESFNYTIEQYVPNNYYSDEIQFISNSGGKYSSFVISDQFDKNLIIGDNIVITDEVGNNVTKYFDIDVTDNKLTASVKSSYLSSVNFYTHKYSITVPASAKAGTGKVVNIMQNSAQTVATNSLGTESLMSNEVDVSLKHNVHTVFGIDYVWDNESYSNNTDKQVAGTGGVITGPSTSGHQAFCYNASIDNGGSYNQSVEFKLYEGYEIDKVILNGAEVPVSTLTKTSSGYSYDFSFSSIDADVESRLYVTTRLKDTAVTVNYLDESGNVLADSVVIDGKVFDDYSTVAKTFTGYELIETPDNASGKMTVDPIVVNYVYKLKDASVVVKYIDADTGKSLTDDVSINGKVFDNYNTEQKSFYGYDLVSVPDNASGKMTEADIEVVYYYTRKDASVVVNYVDESNNILASQKTITGKVGDSYSTKKETIYGYEFVRVDGNTSGNMIDGTITVNYIYKLKDTSVVAYYLDEDGNEIGATTLYNGKVFDAYQTENKSITGYTLKEVPTNASGVMEEGVIIVRYIYSLNDAKVIAHYIDENGNPIADSVTEDTKWFADYNTSSKDIYGYHLTATPDNASGTVNADVVNVTYVYALNGTSVIANYVDEDGHKLADSVTQTGNVFDEYSTSAKTIYGYDLIGTPSNASGTMTEDTITVNYVYRLKEAVVIVRYITDKGVKLIDDVTIDGRVFDEYRTAAKDFGEYNLVSTPVNAEGTMTEDIIVVEYVYTLKDASVTANYVDESGKQIAPSELFTGKVGDDYDTSAKTIYGYESISTPVNASGNMTVDPIVVNYVYRLKASSVVVNYVDENGKSLADSVIIDGKCFDVYNTTPVSIEGYRLTETPSNASGEMTEDQIIVNYVYELKDAVVEVYFVDEEGNELAKSKTINGKVFDEYNTKAESIHGWKLVEVPDNASGTMIDGTIRVTYVYSYAEDTLPSAGVGFSWIIPAGLAFILCGGMFMIFKKRKA